MFLLPGPWGQESSLGGAGWGGWDHPGPSRSPTTWILGLAPLMREPSPQPGSFQKPCLSLDIIAFLPPWGPRGTGGSTRTLCAGAAQRQPPRRGSCLQAACAAAWPGTRAGQTVTPAGLPPPHGRGLGTEVGPEAGAAGTDR